MEYKVTRSSYILDFLLLDCEFAFTTFFFRRLKGLLDGENGKCAIGGETDASENYIAPTILTSVKPTDPIMEDEVLTISPVLHRALKRKISVGACGKTGSYEVNVLARVSVFAL